LDLEPSPRDVRSVSDSVEITDRLLEMLPSARTAMGDRNGNAPEQEPVVIRVEIDDAASGDDLVAEFIDTFDAVEIAGLPPLCDRHARRQAGLDWLGHGGTRLVCGVCRPAPASPAADPDSAETLREGRS
jgi:hypothetical protein